MNCEDIHPWLPLVKKIAAAQHFRVRDFCDFDDIYQEGCIGMLDALRRVNLAHPGAKGFIAKRIRGSILDFLRTFPHAGRGNPVPRVEYSDTLHGRPSSLAFERVERLRDARKLAGRLNGRERLVIEDEIMGRMQYRTARDMGVDPSRISQLRRSAILKMRAYAGWRSGSLRTWTRRTGSFGNARRS